MSKTVALEDLKALRAQTQAPLTDCREALAEAGGNVEHAKALLRQRGRVIAEQRAGKATGEGRVEAYSHMGRIGVVVEVNCETDFVAKTDAFQAFCKDVAMHIAAADPDSVAVLLEQPFVRNERLTVRDHLDSVITKTGENVVITRFTRYLLGTAPATD